MPLPGITRRIAGVEVGVVGHEGETLILRWTVVVRPAQPRVSLQRRQRRARRVNGRRFAGERMRVTEHPLDDDQPVPLREGFDVFALRQRDHDFLRGSVVRPWRKRLSEVRGFTNRGHGALRRRFRLRRGILAAGDPG